MYIRDCVLGQKLTHPYSNFYKGKCQKFSLDFRPKTPSFCNLEQTSDDHRRTTNVQGHMSKVNVTAWKRGLIARLLTFLMKLGSLNLLAMSFLAVLQILYCACAQIAVWAHPIKILRSPFPLLCTYVAYMMQFGPLTPDKKRLQIAMKLGKFVILQ